MGEKLKRGMPDVLKCLAKSRGKLRLYSVRNVLLG